LLAVILAGCKVGPDYKRPALDVPGNFRNAPEKPATNSLADLSWYELFPDENLQNLIRIALTNNYDLRIAITRVEQARQAVIEVRSGMLPQIGYGAGVGRGKNVSNGNAAYNKGHTASSYLGEGTAAWEIDLWGRLRRQTESAQAQYLATEEAQTAVRFSLISAVAEAYFQLLALDAQLEVNHRATNSYGDSLRIFRDRLQEGIVSKLETSAAEGALASSSAIVPTLERQIILQENIINALLGRNPGPVARSKTLLDQTMPPQIPAGLPSQLLERRPDVREAEQQLRSANAQVGAAKGDFFPRLSLTGLFGAISPELDTFTAGGSAAWGVAANLTGPIFQGGRLTARYRQALAARDEAALHYEATVLNAFHEVADGLASIQKLAEAREQESRAVEAYSVAVQVSMQRYVAGRAGYFEVLQQQQQLFPAEGALVQIQLNQYLAMVDLYKALGGGTGM
jgi:multidrug efflux system outer membrane protein